MILGGSQHDAQEFLLWLLDRVHEDLNMASRRLKRHRQKTQKSFDKGDTELEHPTGMIFSKKIFLLLPYEDI